MPKQDLYQTCSRMLNMLKLMHLRYGLWWNEVYTPYILRSHQFRPGVSNPQSTERVWPPGDLKPAAPNDARAAPNDDDDDDDEAGRRSLGGIFG